ncbi:hypothetical protein DB88DRAFT_444285 [Papiliotrema laurentii]|uniref:Histone acetyltransferase n=1 Tax=Papiliotrema laurentii TaxID=5418 RepID=A0AAD9FN79_PAPLA|nr:hypothetical protein DB88DRAFT_444285 [Papiliotrema laurentii]
MPKKRGRPFKNPHLNVHSAHSVHPATPNGHAGSHQPSKPRTPGRRSATPRQPVSTANGKGKGKGKAVPTGQALAGDTIHAAAVIFDPNCSFCYGTDKRNKQGVPERMVSCHRCGRCGHPSCLQMESPQLIETIFGYKWNCMECKACEVCQIKGDDSRLMFCDGCDRGWHSYCLNPPLAKPPKGQWFCPKCVSPGPSQSSAPPCAPVSSKGKGRALSSVPSHLASAINTTPVVKKPRGRPRKYPLPQDTPEPKSYHDGDDNIFNDRRSSVKVKPRSESHRSRKPKHPTVFSDTDENTPPPSGVKIRLRVPGAGRRKTVEVESEEEKIPYGGVITGEDADTSKTAITDRDKELFEKARLVAEAKLGGQPVVTAQPGAINGSPAPSMSSSTSYFPSPGTSTPAQLSSSIHRPLRDRLLQSTLGPATPGPATVTVSGAGKAAQGAGAGPAEKIKRIRFGVYDIDTWYSAPYPEEYQHVPDGRLWLCEFCLKYMKSGFVAGRHRIKCKARHPPGDEIYRKDNVSVFEVDGRKNKIYCQNLCLLAKMFLDHKTLYYDVEPFLFYVMTEVDDLGARFVGYFSKEKRSPDNNVSCIMTLPVRQRKGWGQLLIDFSYLLSKKEERVGGPERPLSGLGEVTYKKYWRLAVFRFLRNSPDNPSLEDISKATSMTLMDVYQTLEDESMIETLDSPPPSYPVSNGTSTPSFSRRGRGRGRGGRLGSARRPTQPKSASPEATDEQPIIPDRYIIQWDRDYVEAVLKKHEARGYLELAPERLKYHPFLVTRNPIKPPGALAKAALVTSNGNSATAQAVSIANDPIVKDGIVEGRENGGKDVPAELEETVLHGEDRATLDLVKALAHQSPQRNLRKRTSSELNTPAPNSLKKLRSSDRIKGMNGTPSRRRKSTAVATPSSRVSGRGSQRGSARKSSVKNGSVQDTEDADAEGEYEDEGEDADADGEWEGEDEDAEGEDEDAEGEDDEEYVE